MMISRSSSVTVMMRKNHSHRAIDWTVSRWIARRPSFEVIW